jgi:hypothetical protein
VPNKIESVAVCRASRPDIALHYDKIIALNGYQNALFLSAQDFFIQPEKIEKSILLDIANIARIEREEILLGITSNVAKLLAANHGLILNDETTRLVKYSIRLHDYIKEQRDANLNKLSEHLRLKTDMEFIESFIQNQAVAGATRFCDDNNFKSIPIFEGVSSDTIISGSHNTNLTIELAILDVPYVGKESVNWDHVGKARRDKRLAPNLKRLKSFLHEKVEVTTDRMKVVDIIKRDLDDYVNAASSLNVEYKIARDILILDAKFIPAFLLNVIAALGVDSSNPLDTLQDMIQRQDIPEIIHDYGNFKTVLRAGTPIKELRKDYGHIEHFTNIIKIVDDKYSYL